MLTKSKVKYLSWDPLALKSPNLKLKWALTKINDRGDKSKHLPSIKNLYQTDSLQNLCHSHIRCHRRNGLVEMSCSLMMFQLVDRLDVTDQDDQKTLITGLAVGGALLVIVIVAVIIAVVVVRRRNK